MGENDVTVTLVRKSPVGTCVTQKENLQAEALVKHLRRLV